MNVCSHGNEVLGLHVIEKIKNLKIVNGSITCNIANAQAVLHNKRFIDSDLNRSFPGKQNGNNEEQIAFYMMLYMSNFDYIIDVHSTVSGIQNCIIIEDDSKEVQKMISVCEHVKTILYMTATKGISIFTATRHENKIIPAIAFEYGDNSLGTIEKTYQDVVNIFSMLGVVKSIIDKKSCNTSEQFECYEIYSKNETDTLNPTVKNYELIHHGDIVGYTQDGKQIISDSDFYPVLFGESHYKTIFGFKARKKQ